jgi:hypothetical protein
MWMITRSDALIAAVSIALCSVCACDARADEPPPSESSTLDPLRERFRAGMEKYRAGAFADAIVIWAAIYGELGAEKGYRLAFNIARAYEQFGENSTQAAEHYEAYVKETSRRRALGETLEAQVEKQEAEAQERLAELAATKGRIDVRSDGHQVAVRIDDGTTRLAGFIAYVTPGRAHVVTFNPGTTEEKKVEVTVGLGRIVSVAPPKPEEQQPLLVSARFETRHERPYSKTVLYVAAGVTAVSLIMPVLFYAKANAIADDYYGPGLSRDDEVRLRADYETARSNYNVSIGVPSLLLATTVGLTAYWLLGMKEVRVPVQGALVPGGATMGALVHF